LKISNPQLHARDKQLFEFDFFLPSYTHNAHVTVKNTQSQQWQPLVK